MTKRSILLADDDFYVRESLVRAMEYKGYQVTAAKNGKEALELLHKKSFDLVITEVLIEETHGFQVLKTAKALNPETMVIFLSGSRDVKTAMEALKLGAEDYLFKPCEAEQIFFRIDGCLEKLRHKDKNEKKELIPVCCVCQKIRIDNDKNLSNGAFIMPENFVWGQGDFSITSTYCPECAQKTFDDLKKLKE